VPVQCDHALDSGCGTGVFARKLARHARFVEAVDKAADVVADARRQSIGTPNLAYIQADFSDYDLRPTGYQFISCLASLHHMPFAETVSRLRDALVPGGVLAVLGCYRTATLADYLHDVVAVPANLAARAGAGMAAVLHGDRGIESATAPISEPQMSLLEVRAEASRLLPGSETRRWLVWRYTLVYRRRERVGDDAYPGPHGFRD